MTIPSAPSEITYAGDGVSTVFPITFVFDTSGDLKVSTTDADGNIAVLSSGFSVTGGGGSTGSLTLTGGPLASGTTLTILDDPLITQNADYVSNDPFPAKTHERALDRGVRISKRLAQLVRRAVRTPDGDPITDNTLGSVNNRKGKYLFFNVVTGAIEYATALIGNTLSQSIIGSFLWPQTADESAAGVTPSDLHRPDSVPWYDARRAGAVTDNVTDNTTAVQRALNALNSTTSLRGGVVYVPKGAKFDLSALTFPARCVLQFFGGDDTSTNKTYTLDTNELITFVANANTGGIVNEQRLTGAFHPGMVVDVRKSVSGHDAFLGGGQSRTDPARASYNLFDDGENRWTVLYQNYTSSYSQISSVSMFGWVKRVTLTNIKTASFSSVPAVGEKITGNTSGAVGFVLSVDATKTIVEWVKGTFVVGESVADSNESSSTTISAMTVSLLSSHTLATDFAHGNWGIGLPAGSVRDVLAVGGRIASAITRTMGQYVDETVTKSGFRWLDSYESSPPNGFDILYDTTIAAAVRRLLLYKYGESTARAFIGATRALVAFDNAVAVSTSRFNVSGVVRNGTGDYTITFAVAFTRADYIVQLTENNVDDKPTVGVKALGTLQILNFNRGTGAAKDIVGNLNVSCFAGDI